MQGSTPQHYTIADFLKWHDDGELQLNPKFQRGGVWPSASRTYLIDSLLRGYPIPKLLLRTTVDRDSRRTVRDVVDGQQRLRTIVDFAANKFVLGQKASEFAGSRYADLDDEVQDAFLAYKLTCEQLINASDEDVLEVFVRINSNAVPVSEPELRNARFDNDFSELVKSLVKQLNYVWDLGVLSKRERVRMVDQSLVAEMLGFHLYGVTDGGEARITRIYEGLKTAHSADLPDARVILDSTHLIAELLAPLRGEPIVQRPHFLMMVAAAMYSEGVLPRGKLSFQNVPPPESLFRSYDQAQDGLVRLNAALTAEESGTEFESFKAAKSSTHWIKSRQTRFEFFCLALAGHFR